MELLERFQFFGPFDFFGVGFLVLSWFAVGLWIENTGPRNPSVSVLMGDYRREWMVQFVTRQPRVFDAAVLGNLRQGTTFFASATMIAFGGGLALIGNTDRLLGLAKDLSLETAPAIIWEVKVFVVLMFVANAFLKFVWAHRLFGYCAIVFATVPNDPEDPIAYPRAAKAAELNITAARSFNRGLRAVYFSLGAAAWLLGPFALILATTTTILVLWRREFASHSREILLQKDA